MKRGKGLLTLWGLLLIISCGSNNVSKKESKSIETSSRETGKEFVSDLDLIEPPLLKNLGEDWMVDSTRKKAAKNSVLLKTNIDTSSITINYFTSSEVETPPLQIKDDGTPLEIIDYGPSGEVPIEMARPSIYIQFSKPMIPVSKLGEPMTESSLFQIKPETDGIFRWYGTSMLSFEPNEALLRHDIYTVEVNKNIKSLSGAELKDSFEFNFYLESLKMTKIYFLHNGTPWPDNKNVPPEMLDKIFIAFNQTVDPDILRKFFEVSSKSDSYDYNIRLMDSSDGGDMTSAHRTVVLEMKETPAKNRSVSVILNKGAQAATTGPATKSNQAMGFHTLTPFQYEGDSRSGYGFSHDSSGTQNPVYLSFNHPLAENAIDFMETSLEGEIDLNDHVSINFNKVRFNRLPVNYGESYTITLKKGLSDIYGQTLNEEKTIEITVPEASSYFAAARGDRVLEANYTPKFIYHFQNLEKGTMKINSSDPENFIEGQIRNEANFKLLDLRKWLNEAGFGSLNMSWNYTRFYYTYKGEKKFIDDTDRLNLQVTNIGLTIRYGYNKTLIWVNNLTTGEAIEGAEVVLKGKENEVVGSILSDEQGLAVIPIPPGTYNTHFNETGSDCIMYIHVTNGEDSFNFEVLPTQYAGRFGIDQSYPEEAENEFLRTFFFTDRGIYKPGETLTLRGVDWSQHLGEFIPYEGEYTINLCAPGYKREILQTITGRTSASGGFYGTFNLPSDLKPENYILTYNRKGKAINQTLYFKVANFRRLNFQLNINVPNRDFVKGDTINLPVEASYLSGGAMAGGNLFYLVTRKTVHFRPGDERWNNWDFGPSGWESEKRLISGSETLDSLGHYSLSIPTDDTGIAGMAYRYILEATVEDIDRQTVSSASSVICHPAQGYLGAHLDGDGGNTRFVEEGLKQNLEICLISNEGEIIDSAPEVSIEIRRGEYKIVQQQGVSNRINTRYEWSEELLETKKIKLKEGMGNLQYTPEDTGEYNLKITAQDKEGREMVTDLSFYSSGSRWVRWASNNNEDINMVVDRDLYFPGETARILIQSPLAKGRYLLTIEREGIVEEKIIELDRSTSVLEIPIKENYLPTMYVTLSSIRERTELPSSFFDPDFGEPKGYFGAAQLQISTETRELDIEIVPDKSVYRPGEEAKVLIKVTREGKPVPNAEIIFLAVDRGILDLINYHVPNPLEYFYDRNNFPLMVYGDDSRRMLLAPVTYETTDLVGGDGNKLERRDDFSPLAVFEPILRTNKKGLAMTTFTFPDTLTTYRATALSLKGNQLGYQEEEIMVQNPINVRTALPRKMRTRDTAFAGCVLHNLDDKDHEVTIEAQSDLIQISGEAIKTVQLPSGAIMEVPFILEALSQGEGEISFRITSDVLNEELVESMTVEKPIIKEVFTTIGSIEEEENQAEEGLIIPNKIGEGFGQVSLSLDSSMIPFVESHIIPLQHNRSGINALMDRMYPSLIFPEYVYSSEKNYEVAAQDFLTKSFNSISRHQNSDGGIFNLYSGENSSQYNLTVQAALLLGLAEKSELVSSFSLDKTKLLEYLVNNYASQTLYMKAFTLYSLSLLNENVSVKADELYKSEDELGLSGYGLLALAYENMGEKNKTATIYKRMKKFVRMGTKGIDITNTAESYDYFDSDFQQMAHLLNLGISQDENRDLIQRLVFGLNPEKHHAYFMRRMDHVWSLIALSRLSEQEAGESTEMAASVTLNGETLLDKEFKGVSMGAKGAEYSLFSSPLKEVQRDTVHSLMIEKEGTGSLYYNITMEYALPNEIAPARDEGISVTAMVETLEGEAVEEGNLTLGETYRYRVILSTIKDRSNVQLSVPVPSGADIVDPSLSSTSHFLSSGGAMKEQWSRDTGYGDKKSYISEGYISYWDWYIHIFGPKTYIYDNRIDYIWDSIYKGQREVSFLFRATTPGVFPTPPASVDLEYEPEVFGRSKGTLYVIR
jgi:alpha-2-macroglobulin